MNLDSFNSLESFKLFFKSVYDSIRNVASIAQSAANSYADLQDAFDRRVVISEEYNGRQSQNINISTTFGDDVGGLNSKEFRFLYGSTLKYDRVLPIDHQDTSEVVNLQTLINLLSSNPNTYLKNTGDTATGSYTFGPDPLLPNTTITLNDVLLSLNAGGNTAIVGPEATAIMNRSAVQALIAAIPPSSVSENTITIGAGSTANSGYASLGSDLAIAWVTGPSTFFSGSTNPEITLNTPVTFDTIYSYSLSSENAETNSLISDNDAWWQMVDAPSGNSFNLILQAVGGTVSGYMIPKLIVIGKLVSTALSITTQDKSIMAANGQVYPMLAYLTLTSSGGVAPITWTLLTSDYSAQFAPGYSNIVQISVPSTGLYPISVKATDANGEVASRIINITITDYTVVTLVITNVDQSVTADTYPFNITTLLNYTGGTAPITWVISSYTALTTAPTITSGNQLNVSFPSAGTYTITVQATDSANTPQVVSKTITFTVSNYVTPPPPPCFESDETYILLEDGSSKLLKDMRAGDKILTISEACLKTKLLSVTSSTVTGVTLIPSNDPKGSITCHNIKATLGHPWSTIDDPDGNLWIRSEAIIPTTKLIEVFKDTNSYRGRITEASTTSKTGVIRVAGNMTTLASTYCVSSSPIGPWFVVHNMISTTC
jgi:hypothetical protein